MRGRHPLPGSLRRNTLVTLIESAGLAHADDKEYLLQEEVLIIRHSGEIPEVAYNGSIYYLTDDPEGPGFDELTPEDLIPLKEAVVHRYRTIILRDLTAENRDKRIYRGLARSAVNWERLIRFLDKEGLVAPGFKTEIARAFKSFLAREWEDVASGRRAPCINCPYAVVVAMASAIGVTIDEIPPGLGDICREG
jgi:hypothetical protein